MKKLIQSLIAILLIFAIAGCKSKQQETVVEPVAEEEVAWHNVTLPVKVSVVKPQKMSFNGTATIVRGEYVYMSFRLLGFEVGAMNITPDEVDVVIKQLSKVWLQESISDKLKQYNVSFTTLQDAMLGDKNALNKLPDAVNFTVGGSETAPAITFSTTVKNVALEATLTWTMESAKWDTDSPATFTEPGSGYNKVSLQQAAKLLGGK